MKKQAKDDQARDTEAKQAEEHRRAAGMKDAACFKVKLVEMGFFELATQTETARKKAMSGKDGGKEFFKTPKLLTCDSIQGIFASVGDAKDGSAAAKLHNAMRRWRDSFPSSDECRRSGKVVAPIYEALGLEAFMSAVEEVLPTKHRCRLRGERVAPLLDKPVFYGGLHGVVHISPEPNFLANLRFQYEGTTKFMLISAMEAEKFLHVTGSKLDWNGLMDIVRSMTEASAKSFKDRGGMVYHGTLTPGTILYVPVGFVVATASTAQCTKHHAALKFSFLPAVDKDLMKYHMICFEALAKFQPAKADATVLETLQDALTVELN